MAWVGGSYELILKSVWNKEIQGLYVSLYTELEWKS